MNTQESINPTRHDSLHSSAKHRSRSHTDRLKPNQMALYLEGENEPILVDVEGRATIGRPTHGNTALLPTIMLNDQDASSKGVSRLHATFEFVEGRLTVLDEYSTNGTWVNGKRIEPMTPVALRSGDEVRLATLWLAVYY